MCGICGIYGEANEPVVKEMLDTIRHRGPDAFEVLVTDRHSLGATRLALVAREEGHQPHRFERDSLVVLLNGEVYNYRELGANLPNLIRGPCSEVEVIGALYREYGPQAIPMLKGMFALAILDSDRLILARDRFGIKPLFYCQAGKTLLFASEVKALLRHPRVTPVLNTGALDQTAVFGFICSPEETPFEGIYQIPPGTIMTVTPDSISRETFYTIPPARYGNGSPISFSAAADRLEEMMSDSMARLMGHGQDRKGLYLSGGIDSSLLTVLASRASRDPLLTFTLHDSAESPDLEAARRVARAVGSDHFEFEIDVDDYLNELPHYIYHYENLVAGGVFDLHGGVAFHLLSRRVADHVRIAFSGEGADELFGGYYWSHLHPLGLSDRIRDRRDRLGVRGYMDDLIDRVFPQPEEETTYRLNVFDLLMQGGLANYHLWSVDRSGSAFGFEIRPAYLFDELAEFALSLPVEYKVNRDETKRILRGVAGRLFREYGIADIATREKQGMPAAVQRIGRQVEEFAGRVMEPGRLSRHPFAKYLRSPLEAMMFDLFHWIFFEQHGRLPAGFNLKEFYGDRMCEKASY